MMYLFIGVIAVVGFFIASAILFGISKLFRITNATFKKSMIISFLTEISSLILIIILALFGLKSLSSVITVIVAFFVFNHLFKKYYQSSFKQALGVYSVNIILGIIISFAIVVPIRLLLGESFVVSGQSMSPHFNEGDYLYINKLDHDFHRDDVVVFTLPNTQAYLIKRIIGLPTEKIEIKKGQLFINGNQFKDSFLESPIQGDVGLTLAADEYFVLSDNAAPSVDSRIFGPIKSSAIIGKAAK